MLAISNTPALTLLLPRDSSWADSLRPKEYIFMPFPYGFTESQPVKVHGSLATFFLWQAYYRYCGLSVRASRRVNDHLYNPTPSLRCQSLSLGGKA